MSLERNYENLANAIIMQAVKDYRNALKKPGDIESAKVEREVKRFFRSGWFATLTDIDPESLIVGLDAEVEI